MFTFWDRYIEHKAYEARKKRFIAFEQFISFLPKPLNIIDLGGENAFWEIDQWNSWALQPGIRITMINIKPEAQRYPNIIPRIGDARDLHEYPDGSFDLVFSNSCIQLLYDRESQKAMAAEVRRLAPNYWVQTPNFWFPIESHTRLPLVQFLPKPQLIQVFHFFHRNDPNFPDLDHIHKYLDCLRLLSRRELSRLFPGAILLPEKLFGLVKSWTAVHRDENPRISA